MRRRVSIGPAGGNGRRASRREIAEINHIRDIAYSDQRRREDGDRRRRDPIFEEIGDDLARLYRLRVPITDWSFNRTKKADIQE